MHALAESFRNLQPRSHIEDGRGRQLTLARGPTHCSIWSRNRRVPSLLLAVALALAQCVPLRMLVNGSICTLVCEFADRSNVSLCRMRPEYFGCLTGARAYLARLGCFL